MPDGARVWDSAGNVVSDHSDFLPRFLGRLDIVANTVASGAGAVSGSLDEPGFLTGIPFLFKSIVGGSHDNTNTISISGTTLSWNIPPYVAQFGRPGGSVSIVYGVR